MSIRGYLLCTSLLQVHLDVEDDNKGGAAVAASHDLPYDNDSSSSCEDTAL